MNMSEELDHKRVQAVYLRKLLDLVYEEIAELETPVDPYAALKAAHAAGKRIAIKSICRGESTYVLANRPKWDGIVNDYKIIEDDETATKYFYFNDSVPREIKVTKCALTGNVTAEVLNAY